MKRKIMCSNVILKVMIAMLVLMGILVGCSTRPAEDEAKKSVADYVSAMEEEESDYDNYEEVLFEEGLLSVQEGDKWGAIDETGKMVIEPKFDWVFSFENGLATTDIGEKTCFINREGEVVIPPKFDFALGSSYGKLYDVEDENGLIGLIDVNGDYVYEPQFTNIEDVSPNGLIYVEKDGLTGFADQEGNLVVNTEYDDADDYFRNGFVWVQKNDKYGFVDESGKMTIDLKFDYVEGFADNGLALARLNDKFGYINKVGEFVIEPQFRKAESFSKNSLACVKKGGKWGFIDETGNVVIDFQFERAFSFDEIGLAEVFVDGKYGLINKEGHFVIEPQYRSLMKMKFGDTYVVMVYDENDNNGCIGVDGNLIADLKYDWIEYVCNSGNLVVAEKNYKYGVVDKFGNVVIPFEYEEIGPFCGGAAWAHKGKQLYRIKEDGTIVMTTTVRKVVDISYVDGYALCMSDSKKAIIFGKDGKQVGGEYDDVCSMHTDFEMD